MMRNWGRLPYPKFMETTDCIILAHGEEVWRGLCYFAWRSRHVQQPDAQSTATTATATTDQDIVKILAGFGDGELEFRVQARGFLVEGMRPSYNPDGSFHHLAFELLCREEEGAA